MTTLGAGGAFGSERQRVSVDQAGKGAIIAWKAARISAGQADGGSFDFASRDKTGRGSAQDDGLSMVHGLWVGP